MEHIKKWLRPCATTIDSDLLTARKLQRLSMRYAQVLGSAVALAGYGQYLTANFICTNDPIAVAQEGEVQSKVVCDAETKIFYASYLDAEAGMTFGIALPKNVTDPYDAILKITASIANTWAGFSWGGNMVWNPLGVAWPNGKSGTTSARFAL